MVGSRRRWALLAAAVFFCVGAAPPAQKVIARIDLSKPFHLPPGASFTATQGPDIPDPVFGDGKAPGPIHLCIRLRPATACSPNLDDTLRAGRDVDLFSDIHDLYDTSFVYPRGRSRPPLLQLRVASLDSPADRLQAAIFVAYHPRDRAFAMVFRERFGRNNNQEVRLITSGPLKGDIISAQSPDGPPFSYVVSVNRLTGDYRYKRVLRYRSATRYGDGNPLAVIDSEMPNILRRLGLWKAGQPLPLPAGRCPRPHLVKGALWC